ncbi:hypothetical protein [Massilia sp. H6]|uniref:hypothetical protein n=1 Tax=Massilia sp. H6 TaxID=2970464 RepID=UPI0021686FC2|nr:hypothetical protein [Massilia sp. H6]UVW29432.1 hypothetical protein NRS07_04690 [Massilia sp. H6]
MIFLRLACLLIGVMVLVAPPVVLFPAGALSPNLALTAAIVMLLLLASAGFFFIAITGHRIRREPALRRLGAMLLGAPLLLGVVTLWLGTDPTTLWMSAMLLGLTLIVLLVLVYPLLTGPSAARLRARDGRRGRREPMLYQA